MGLEDRDTLSKLIIDDQNKKEQELDQSDVEKSGKSLECERDQLLHNALLN